MFEAIYGGTLYVGTYAHRERVLKSSLCLEESCMRASSRSSSQRTLDYARNSSRTAHAKGLFFHRQCLCAFTNQAILSINELHSGM